MAEPVARDRLVFVGDVHLERDDPELLEDCLRDLRDLLGAGRLSRLTLMFADGIEATVVASHRWRLWRRQSALLD